MPLHYAHHQNLCTAHIHCLNLTNRAQVTAPEDDCAITGELVCVERDATEHEMSIVYSRRRRGRRCRCMGVAPCTLFCLKGSSPMGPY